MSKKTLRLRDLNPLDIFRFADDRLNHKFMGYTLTNIVEEITGYAYNYVTYNTINMKKGVITGHGYYICDNPEVIKIGNARDIFPRRYANWYK